GNTNYGGIGIVGTESAKELTVTTTSYSTHDTHSLDQTLNGSGDKIWSIVGAGNIKTTGSGIEIDPVQGTMTIDAGVQGEGAVVGVGAFGNAKIVNTTLHTDTSHSASASAHIGKMKGRFVVAGAGAGNIEANLEAGVIVDPSQGIMAQADLFLGAEGAVACVGAFEKGKIKNTTLSADTSHSASASGDIHAIGAAVVAGAAAGNAQAQADSSSGLFAIGAEGAVIGGWGSWKGIDGIGKPKWYKDHYKIDATNLNATTSIGEGTSVEGDVAVAGGRYKKSQKAAGVAAGYAHIPADPSDAHQYGWWSGDGEQAGDWKKGGNPISGHGTASVNKDV
ncbi:MAG: hypothetical protein KAW82_06475, partial [Desulfurellaceae bacterium]|nr:hypothetical protein [Desulfurellaceae bacterium]